MGDAWNEDAAESASFLAVVPPTAIITEIQQLQTAAGLDTAVLPHITVKAQPGLQEPTRWTAAVRRAVAAVRPFPIQLGPIDWFGREILFLKVRAEEVDHLHSTILEALARVGLTERFEYDGDAFVPHLTLGAVFAGATRLQLETVARAADARVWRSFAVDTVVEFHRGARDELYEPRDQFVLGGN
jgi:2'-5' RNA ligase